ncbi:MAG: heme-dependent oxidative N-demethylase family protein [Beijerinckiaceae bacterium]
MDPAGQLRDKRPFTIGLAPLDPAEWITPDERLPAELRLKDELIGRERGAVFQARADTILAQQECLDLLLEHLIQFHSTLHRRHGNAITIAGRSVMLEADAPLLIASRLVQDDLCLMRRHDDGWRLVAASLCFPSSWRLAEKFDRPMTDIHAPVPNFAGQMASRVERIFDCMQAGTQLYRMNWSIYPDNELRHASGHSENQAVTNHSEPAARAHCLRMERQTLTKLPVSGDILFTIRIFIEPIAALAGRPELAAALHQQFLALSDDQRSYKGLQAKKAAIADILLQMSR